MFNFRLGGSTQFKFARLQRCECGSPVAILAATCPPTSHHFHPKRNDYYTEPFSPTEPHKSPALLNANEGTPPMKTKSRRKRCKRKFPTAGWVVVQVCDLKRTASPFHPEKVWCERCGQALRFAHTLQHENWHSQITVERCCAERLSPDYAPQKAERELSNQAAQRKRFPSLDGWRLSGKGNPYIEYHGATITVFSKACGYSFCVNCAETCFSAEQHQNIEIAKLAAWDAWWELVHCKTTTRGVG